MNENANLQCSIFGTSPKGWYIDRLRDRLSRIVGGEWGEDPATSDDGIDIVVVRVADIRGLDVTTTDLTIRNVKETKIQDRLIGKQSILIEKSGGGEKSPVGRSVLGRAIHEKAICSNFMAKTDCLGWDDTLFIAYLLDAMYSSGVNTAHIQQTTGIQNLRVADYLNSIVALPPLPEQIRIAAYLDASCTAIDAAVNAKKKQIESLEKLIESTIFNAVTGGINNQFAKKPSGLDWIDTIPSHWKVQQIKRRCNILRGKFSHRPRNDPAFYGGEYPFIQTGDITAAAKYIQSYSQTLNELGLSVSKMFPQNTLVMTIAANIGDVAILDFEACFPDSIVGLVPDHNTDLNYLYYLMIAIKRLLLRAAILTTQLNLNNVRIGTIFVPFPPVEEQTQIAEQLEDKILKIRHIITNIESQIATLIDYRKSLIHECVTGQRRISEADVAKVERTLDQAAAGLPQQ